MNPEGAGKDIPKDIKKLIEAYAKWSGYPDQAYKDVKYGYSLSVNEIERLELLLMKRDEVIKQHRDKMDEKDKRVKELKEEVQDLKNVINHNSKLHNDQ